jgi:hypothetical protein
MKQSFLAGSTAALALFAGTTAFADVTPEEVWENWQAMLTSSGQTVTTTDVSRDGDTLVVSGLTLSYEKDGASFSASIDELDFTDNNDGTVDVTLSDSYPMLIKAPAAAGVEGSKPTDMKITISQPELVLTASGTTDDMTYDVDAPTVVAKVEAINGTDSSVNDLTLEATLTNVVGSYKVAGPAEKKQIASDFTTEKVAFVVSGKDPEKKTDFSMTGSVDGLAGKSAVTMVDMKDMAAALAAGFAMNSTFSYTASSFDATATTEGKPIHVTGTSGEGGLTMAMDATHLQYGGSAKAAKFSMTSPDIPFPQVDLGYDEASFNLDIPTAKSDTPSDFAFLTKLVGFNVSEPIWGMVDPTGALPHDGATLIIDAKGKTTLKSDLFSEMEQGAMGSAPPPELNALDLNEIKVSIAGAELTGNGALTFDNTDMTTFDGVPAPTGKIDLKLTGANTLLDKIVAMGYLTQDDAMGYKMMAGMFTNSAPDKDELTSALEFKDKGFYANGQRLK